MLDSSEQECAAATANLPLTTGFLVESSYASKGPPLSCSCDTECTLNPALSSIPWVFEHSLAFVVLKIKTQGISKPPCGKSDDYRLPPDIKHFIVPPLLIKMKQIGEIVLGTWPKITSSFVIATACVSFRFPGSLLQMNSSPMDELASHISLYTWYPRTMASILNECIILYTLTR